MSRYRPFSLLTSLHGLLTGRELEKAVNLASVDDPDALRWYARFAAGRAR
ncbi:hypothetical protein GCM10027258_88830 [Amycolatopsis stemonae]